MNIPDGYLRQQTKLPAKATVELMEGVWKEQATLEDYAALYVFQGGKAFTEICYPKLEKDYNKTTDAFIEVLKDATKASAFKSAAQFLIDHPYAIKKMILQEKKNALYLLAVNAKAKEAGELLSSYVDLKESDTKAAEEKKPDKVITDTDIKISGNTLTVTNGVTIIPAGTVTFNKGISEIVLPDTVKMIYEDGALGGIKVNLPSGYLKTQEKLPDKFTSTLLVDQWRKQASLDDYAALYLYQGGKCLKELSFCELKWSPDESAKAMIRVLSESGRSKDYPKAAEFFYTYHPAIQNDTIQKMHDLAVSVKSKKAIEILDPIMGAGLNGNAPEKKEIEIYCHDHFSEYALSRSTILASSSEWDGSVKYKDSDEIAPGYVVQCAVAPYINMVFNNDDLKICKEADHVAKELDRESLIAALDDRDAGRIIFVNANNFINT